MKRKRFRSRSNRVSFPSGKMRKLSVDIKVKRIAYGEAMLMGNELQVMKLNIAIWDDEKTIREYVFKAFDVAAF